MDISVVSNYATKVTDLTSVFSYDLAVIAVAAILLFIFALRYGKESILSLIFSLYVGLLVFLHFPYMEQFLFFKESATQLLLSKALIFLVFVVISYVILNRVVYSDYSPGVPGRWFEAGLLSGAAILLLLAFSYQILPVTTLYDFGDSMISTHIYPTRDTNLLSDMLM